MRLLWIVGLSLLATAVLTVGQETKPEEKHKPTEIKLAELPRPDRLEIENLYLRLESLQSQIQRLQTEAQVIQQDRLPGVIAQMKQRKEFAGYDFDYASVSFKLTTKP